MKCLIDSIYIDIATANDCFNQGGQLLMSQSDYPAFNVEMFSLINGGILLSFIVGHFSGRLVRWMSKI